MWPLGWGTYILNFNKIDFLHPQVLSYICLVKPLHSFQKSKMYTVLSNSSVRAVRVTATLKVSTPQKSQRACFSALTTLLLPWERTDIRLVGFWSLDWTELKKILSVPIETVSSLVIENMQISPVASLKRHGGHKDMSVISFTHPHSCNLFATLILTMTYTLALVFQWICFPCLLPTLPLLNHISTQHKFAFWKHTSHFHLPVLNLRKASVSFVWQSSLLICFYLVWV